MKALLIVAVLLLVGIAGFGFYQGWFRVSTEGMNQQPSATFTVDKDKIHADKEAAMEEVQELGLAAKEKTNNNLTEEVEP